MGRADPEFRTDIERMLVYHSWARGKFLNLFEQLPWRVLTKKRGSTFESIRNVHLHVLEVYASWLALYFKQNQLEAVLSQLEESQWPRIRSVPQMRRMNRKIDASVQKVASSLEPKDFDKKKGLKAPNGKSYLITPRQVLWHMIEEDFLHHGEIICMLWQDDIEPPYTGVWWFEYDHDPARHKDSAYSDPNVPRPPAGGYVRTRKSAPRSGRKRTKGSR